MSRSKQIFTIPNILSFLRIALIPVIIILYLKGLRIWSVVVIVLSALTDVVDGYIARHFDQVSALGKALDPVADKLTLLAIILCLCLETPALYVLFGIFLIKEVLMGIEGIIIIRRTGTTYSAKWFGKITTVLLYLSAITEILWTDIPPAVTYIIFSICLVAVVFSFIMYTAMNVRRLNNLKTDNNE